MDTQTIDQLKQISAKKETIRRCTEKEGRIFSKEEQDLIRQLDSERDEILGDLYFKAH